MDTTADSQFWGEYEHGVDDKGRVVIPQDFRAGLGDEFVLTRAPDKAIFVFPKTIWADIEQRLRSSVLQRQAGFLQRMLGGRTYVRLDPQFRLAVPKHLRDWAGITQSEAAAIIGQGPKIEIWNKGNWDEYNAGNFNYSNLYDAAEAVGLAEAVGT